MTRLIDVVEIDLNPCEHDYGVSPCTAALGVTGSIKCYKGRPTCQDLENFSAGAAQTWRFARAADYLAESGIEAIPSLVDIGYRPGTIRPGEGLGERATLTVSFKDHRWADTGPNVDPYLSTRSFDPWRQGTFWGRWRARNPHMRGLTLRWKQGRLGDALGDFVSRTFIVERFDGPGLDGRYTLTARDALQMLFDDRAQCPAASRGRLVSGIDTDDVSATLTPSGIGDDEYDASGWLNLGGKEIVAYSRSGDTLTLTRAQWGTDAAEHDAGARVQLCAAFIAVSPAEALERLETQYGDVDAGFIPSTEWADEVDAFYGGGLLNAFIAEPTPTRQLAEEVIRECGLSTWWDELDARVRLQVIRDIATDALLFDARTVAGEGNVVAASFAVEEQPDRRISRALLWFGQVNPLDGLDRTNLPLFVYQVQDAAAETAAGGQALDEIFSRWIAAGGTAAAEGVTGRRLARYVEAPRRFTVRVPRWGTLQPRLGQGCRLMADTLQDETGATVAVSCQIVRVDPNASRGAEYELTLEELRLDPDYAPAPLNNTVVFAADQQDINALGVFLSLYEMPAAGDEVFFIVNEGVTLGSTDSDAPAILFDDYGAFSWPVQDEAGATRTSASPVLTGLGDTSDLVVGQGVVGTGIPRGARILSVDSGSQITLDTNATSSGTGAITIGLVIIHLIVRGTVSGKGGNGGQGKGGDNNAGGNGEDGGTAIETAVPIRIEGAGTAQAGGGGGGGGAGDYVGFFQNPKVRGASGGGGAGALAGQPGAAAGTPGDAGTLTQGGDGKPSTPSSQGWGSGAGGDPGEPGSPGYGYLPGAGGAAGAAIDGWSFVDDADFTGTITGATVN